MNLLYILGTAAELIKIYPLIVQGEKRGVASFVLSTGQSALNFWKQYDDFELPRNRASQAVATDDDLKNSAQAFKWFTRSILTNKIPPFPKKPDFVCIHGDTLSTVVGAKWGRQLKLPVVHIEAGMRSHNWLHPFPEEINRRFAAKLTTYHMAPDEKAAENLRQEGFSGITVTGANTVYDSVRLMSETTPLRTPPYILANLHRFENLHSKERWECLISTLEKASRIHPVVFVMHPPTEQKLGSDASARERLRKAGIEMIPRQMFKPFINMLSNAEFIITDGGSNQEECFYLGKPCLILREKTERQEGLESNALLSELKKDKIEAFLANPQKYKRHPWNPPASPTQIILDTLEQVRK